MLCFSLSLFIRMECSRFSARFLYIYQLDLPVESFLVVVVCAAVVCG